MNSKQYFDNYLYNLPEFNYLMMDTYKTVTSVSINTPRCMEFIKMHYDKYSKVISEIQTIINSGNNVDTLIKQTLDKYRESIVYCVYLSFDLMKSDPVFKNMI